MIDDKVLFGSAAAALARFGIIVLALLVGLYVGLR